MEKKWLFEYHTFLHHSQTDNLLTGQKMGLSTIHFYIILKLDIANNEIRFGLSTIHFYIILKPSRPSMKSRIV
ncbi:hypothetical protein IMSAGC015_02355 [Lachnospiraceae bacterium]|nr:hypothetical protein IMSAGC015_02355 [Lachnospiraceae bacterium]